MLMIKKYKDDTFCLDHLYNNVVEHEFTCDPRTPCFRLSSSPFCTLKTIFEWQDYINGNQTWSFKGDFYCNIGTAVHRTLQHWLPKLNPATVIGHWRCMKCCKHLHEEECVHCTKKCSHYVEASVGPQICPDCGKPMEYEEFQYLLPKLPVSGHSDGLLLFDPASQLGISKDLTLKHVDLINKCLRSGDYQFPAYILEYKTTSKNSALNILQPIPHHKAQASMYVGACQEILAKKYGLVNLDVKGMIIKYISRDNPDIRAKDFVIEADEDNGYYKYNKKMIYRIVKAFFNKKPELLLPDTLPCDQSAPYQSVYADCPHQSICPEFRKDFNNILSIYKQSRKEFIKEMERFEEKFNHVFKR